MIQNFLNVFQQVMAFFVLGVVGLVLTNRGIIDKRVETGLSDIVLYIASPCIIVSSFMREFDTSMMRNIIINAVLAFLIHLIALLLGLLLIHDKDKAYRNLLRFAAMFFNCGQISLPLATALFGSDGAMYCSIYMAMTNILIWTYGYLLMSGSGGKLQIRKVLINPGFFAVFAGILIFLFSIQLPVPVSAAVNHLGSMNAPLGLILIGSRLSGTKLKEVFNQPGSTMSMLIRLVIAPVILIVLMYVCGLRGALPVIAVICACPPAANLTGLFAIHFHNNENAAARIVLQQTIVSLLTITVIVTVAQTIFM